MTESEEGLKSVLMKEKEESEKTGLNLNIQKIKIMASSLIISWQKDDEKLETVADFIFLDSKITVDGDCSHDIKRHLFFGRKAMTSLGTVKKAETSLCRWASPVAQTAKNPPATQETQV